MSRRSACRSGWFSVPSLRSLAVPGFILALVFMQGAWILGDDAPMPHTDSYNLLARTLEFMHSLGATQAVELVPLIGRLAMEGRPPLYQLMTIPLLALFGVSDDVALLLNLAFLALLAGSVFAAGTRLAGRGAGLLAAVLVSTYPPITSLLHIYRPHAAIPACVALTLWAAILVVEERSRSSMIFLPATLLFGTLIHPIYVYFAAAPVAFVLIYLVVGPPKEAGLARRSTVAERLQSNLSDPLFWKWLIPATSLAALLSAAWYVTWGRRLFSQYHSLVSESLASYRGYETLTFGFPEIPGSPYWYLQTAPYALSWPLALLGAAGLVAGVASKSTARRLLALQVVSGYLLQTALEDALAWWRLVGVLPALGLLSSLLLTTISRRRLRAFVVASLSICAIFNFVFVLGAAPSRAEPLARLLGASIDTPTCEIKARSACVYCPVPPEEGSWPLGEILERIALEPKCKERTGCVLTVVQGKDLSTVLFRYWKERIHPELKLEILNLGSSAWGHQFRLEALMTSDFLLYPGASAGGNNFNSVTLRFLQSPPPSFQRTHRLLQRFRLPDGSYVRLVERTGELSAQEVEEVLSALALDPRYTKTAGALLARLYRKEGDPETAKTALLSTIELPPGPGHVPTLLELAGLELELGDREAAIEWLTTAAELAPASTRPNVLLARIHLRNGDPERAVKELETAAAKAPADSGVQKLLAAARRRLLR
jgi:tetratricopeptide (TPR) repeat protein